MSLRIRIIVGLNTLANTISAKFLDNHGYNRVLRIFRSIMVGQKVSYQHPLCPYKYTTRMSGDLRELRPYIHKMMPLESWAHWIENAKCITDGDTVIDIGAHVGMYTIYFSYLCRSDGKVYAFEPERSNYELLCENIAQNEIVNCLPQQLALSNEKGMVLLHLNPMSTEGHTIMASGYSWGREQHEQQMVKSDTLDAFCRANGIEWIKLVKIDVESAHFLVLQGATGLLSDGRIEVVICEAGSRTHTITGKTDQELFAFMGEFGYTPYLVVDNVLVEVDPNQQYAGLKDFVFINSVS